MHYSISDDEMILKDRFRVSRLILLLSICVVILTIIAIWQEPLCAQQNDETIRFTTFLEQELQCTGAFVQDQRGFLWVGTFQDLLRYDGYTLKRYKLGIPVFAIIEAKDGDTSLILKKLIPVRLIKNEFYHRVKEMEDNGASRAELYDLLGKGRAKLGMFEGDLQEGELEIGQVAGLINEIKPAAAIIEEIITEFETLRSQLSNLKL